MQPRKTLNTPTEPPLSSTRGLASSRRPKEDSAMIPEDQPGARLSLWRGVDEQFRRLEEPQGSFTGQTVIVTGSNCGIGLEAARRFVRMGAAKVILACRNSSAAEAAKQDIEQMTHTDGVVEAWHIDLSSFDSVKAFSARVAELDRLDILVNNAAVLPLHHEVKEGYESMTVVNAISMLLLILLVLPTLRKSGIKHNTTPKIVTVSSDGAFMTRFSQKTAPAIFEELRKASDMNQRYNTTKLLQLAIMHRLASAADASGKGHVIMNSLNPGLVRSNLFRNIPFPISLLTDGINWVFGRTSEMASTTIIDSALQGEDSHDTYRSSCEQRAFPNLLVGEEGEKLMDRVWTELLAIMETIEPGVTGNI